MKLELIRKNLELCEQALAEENTQAAVEQACLTARLLLLRSAEWQSQSREADLKKSYIALVGVTGAVRTQLEKLEQKQNVSALPEKLRADLDQIRKEFAAAEEAYNTLVKLHEDILSEEQALLEEKEKLEETKKKIEELTQLKETELVELRKAVQEQRNKLSQLEKEYTQCEKIYLSVEKELRENLILLEALPEKTGENTLDDLVVQAKQHRQTLETARETSSEPLRKIIEEVQRLERIAEGKP